jgi:hypothetical protein
MTELEETGLSKEEILYEEVGGLPLKEFSSENVIDKALRQDIGPDPTLAMNKRDYRHDDGKNIDHYREYKKKNRDMDPVYNSNVYSYEEDTILKRKQQIEFESKINFIRSTVDKPPTFLNKPLTRKEMREKFMK